MKNLVSIIICAYLTPKGNSKWITNISGHITRIGYQGSRNKPHLATNLELNIPIDTIFDEVACHVDIKAIFSLTNGIDLA